MQILLFAGARETIQADFVELEVLLPATVAEIKTALGIRFPELSPYLSFSRFAIDSCFVEPEHLVHAGAEKKEFALIPPVSGG